MVGSFGDATCFSFYANKTITTGEGGMLVTNDDAIYARAKVMRLHGIDRDIWNRFTASRPSWEYDVVAPGFKYNLPDLAAAVGLAQLERAQEFRDRRQAVAERYLADLADLPGVDLPRIACALEDHSWHFFWLVLQPEARLSRDAFIEGLIAREIGFSVHYKPLHRMTYYRDHYQLRPADFPNAERHWRGCVSLPLYPGMTDAELDYVVRAVRELLSPA
jgi:dTDP-4-amino-4,6-dideoxygalactose transaminase